MSPVCAGMLHKDCYGKSAHNVGGADLCDGTSRALSDWLLTTLSPDDKCVRFRASTSGVRLSVGSYRNLVNWYCSLLIRRTVCRRAAGNTTRTQNKPSQMIPDIVWTQLWRYKTTVIIKRHQKSGGTRSQKVWEPLVYNIYCICKLEPSLYPWLLLFCFLPSKQSR